MKHLLAFGAVLFIASVAACAVDNPDPSEQRIAGSGDRPADSPSALQSDQIQPNVTTTELDPVFADGCMIKFWCHNDNAAEDKAGFCIRNACDGSAPNHASSFCANNCEPGACSVITNFAACN